MRVAVIGLISALVSFGFPKAAGALDSRKAPSTSATSFDDKVEVRGPILPVARPDFRDTDEAKAYQPLCELIFITNKNNLDLKPMEERLLCGDKNGGEIGTPWAQIPPNEAAYFLKGFLQTRGFHHPEFYQDNGRLYVKTGAISRMKTLDLAGGPVGWKPPKRRLIEGEPLTPALLNDMQAWAMSKIKDEGFACAEATIEADPDTGEAVVFYSTGERKRIRGISETGDKSLHEGALDRYNAFIMNDYYKDRLIGLSRRRTLDDGFLQTLVLTTKCGSGDAVTLNRDVSLGPPRTVRIGIGGSTDLGARFKTVLRQSRIGASASSAEARLDASYLNEQVNQQNVSGTFKWYYLHGENRYSLNPTVNVIHDASSALEVRSEEFALLHGWTFDTTEGRYDLHAGPDFLNENQSRGPNAHNINIGFISLEGRWTDHDFEWFNTSPRTGEYIDVTAYLALQKLGSPFTAQRFQVSGEKLWPVGAFDPPLLVLGTRFNFSSVFSPDGDASLAELPVRFRTFLGGETNLRGYSYRSLPRSQVGALSGANVSGEARLHKVLFRIIDIFGFVDAGQLGRSQFQLDQPIFMSPGMGLRWESPFGVLRGYVARRFALLQNPDEEPYDRAFRVGVTFGEEF